MRNNYFHEDSHFFQVLYQPCCLRAQLHNLGFLKDFMTPVDLINSFCADFHVRSASVLKNIFGVQSDMPCQMMVVLGSVAGTPALNMTFAMMFYA